MRFEEALSKMREGAKIRHKYMSEDEYYQACFVRLNPFIISPDGAESYNLGISIAWMKGECLHPDMNPKRDIYNPKDDPCKHGNFPMINLLWLMSDEWEIVEEKC